MIRAYKYLFYKLCLFERITFDLVPGVTAFCLMLVLQFFNLFSLYLVLNRFFWFSLPLKWSAANFGCMLLCSHCRSTPFCEAEIIVREPRKCNYETDAQIALRFLLHPAADLGSKRRPGG